MKKILIVDDEAHIRRLLEQTLEDFEDEGVELLVAADGMEGFRAVKQHRPDIAFFDVMMPKLSGLDLTRKVREELEMKDIYIVLLTAKGQEIDKKNGIEAGADLYMTKPFNPTDVIDKVSEILEIAV